MIFRSLGVDRFRNLGGQEVPLHPHLTVLCGDNGQGKTNFLEAIYFFAALRSFRSHRPGECIRFGESEARLEGQVESGSHQRRISITLHPGSREVAVDGKRVARVRDFRGDFGAVLFTPEDLGLARGPPAERRRLLDRGVFTAFPAHLADLLDYQRALRARNALLRDGLASDENALAHTVTLARLGAVVVARRLRWIASLRPRLAEVFREVAATEATADLGYEPTVPGLASVSATAEIEEALLGHWERARERDLARGYTGTGPHADDLALSLDGRPLRLAGSQGQQRAFVLALKLAEIRFVEEVRGELPALLLDDVGSELDLRRRTALFRHLDRVAGQVLVTTTAPELVPLSRERFQYRALAGVLTREI
jgi:DNA replication and repair protein RecF